ncbi:hypothetical protein L1887_31853 [Cichorium endivia]|nr:hypothetical protein L1887_31853 [Cichorium endivia]
MRMTRREIWSWTEDVLPFVAMLIIICLDMSLITIVKSAMNGGMNSFVYVVYHNALGTLILLPFFIIHIFRNVARPPLTFHILLRFFILGLLGICLFQVLLYIGVGYSSPTMASAISNLSPGNTFLLAVAFRMEKINLRRSTSRAKLFGTIIAISGAMTATAREYPDQFTIVFFFCLFGTIQSTVLVFILERNPKAWVVQPGIGMVAVAFGAVFSTVFRSTVVTWCLKKKGPVFVAMFNPLSIVIASAMGVTFLGDSLHLGSAIGAVIVAAGFYSVMLGQAKEKKMDADLGVADHEPESSNPTTPLLSSGNELKR